MLYVAHCVFLLQNPDYMKDGFKLTIETLHAPDRGTQENVHQLDAAALAKREVVFIDIGNDPIPPNNVSFLVFHIIEWILPCFLYFLAGRRSQNFFLQEDWQRTTERWLESA